MSSEALVKVYDKARSTPDKWKRGRPEQYTADEMIDAIEACHGVVSQVAQKLRCSRNTVYRYAERYATVKQALEDMREDLIDNVENAMYENALRPSGTVDRIFLLKNLGRHRGWADRHTKETVHREEKRQVVKFGDRQIEF